MTFPEVAAICSILMSLLSLGGIIYFAGFKLATLEVKVNTMWDFQLRRAYSESIQKGVATINSPLTVTPEAKEWMNELAVKLRDFYSKLGRHLTERDLAIEIERRFGEEILHKVCIPNGLYEGACLIIAMEIAKEVLENRT